MTAQEFYDFAVKAGVTDKEITDIATDGPLISKLLTYKCPYTCGRMEIIVNNMIYELEKIKTEISQIDKIYYPDLSFNETGDCYIQRKSVADVIDKHMEELGAEAGLPIRCKDCEFYMPEKEYRCFLLPKIHPTEDWFCGFAKRKENK